MKHEVLLGILTASVMSCSGATEPVATVSATVINLTSGSLSMDAMLDVVITNQTSVEVQLAPCGGASLDRQNASGEWVPVWSVACAAISNNEVIRPESSLTIKQRITAQGNSDEWPAVGLVGTYRLRYYIFPSDALMKRMSSVTNLITATPLFSNEFGFPAS